MAPYADLIQLTHLKLQQAIQRMTPSGVYLDADGLAEIDLGNGNKLQPTRSVKHVLPNRFYNRAIFEL